MHMLGYTKWEHWSLTMIECVYSALKGAHFCLWIWFFGLYKALLYVMNMAGKLLRVGCIDSHKIYPLNVVKFHDKILSSFVDKMFNSKWPWQTACSAGWIPMVDYIK